MADAPYAPKVLSERHKNAMAQAEAVGDDPLKNVEAAIRRSLPNQLSARVGLDGANRASAHAMDIARVGFGAHA